ncbi:hypothetical protein C8R45DRAFT_1004654 [Mycena sanguinolenta]|nr:hypothetical protein C8R45DRAFT_1019155 [Mycena sanguinolenta]KAJ6481156.1 hypothetical protein C8R45DRAFT_1004654 [Mycena sanguinolenta]
MFLVPEPHQVSSASPRLKDSKILTLNKPEVHSFEPAAHSFKLALTSLILRSHGLHLLLSCTPSSQTTPNRGLFAPSHFEYDTGAVARLSRHLQRCYTRHQHRKRNSIQDIKLAPQVNSSSNHSNTLSPRRYQVICAIFGSPPLATSRPLKLQLHRHH